MKAQAVPQAIIDFIGQWLNACITALFSPAEFGRAETETLPKLVAFAASSATIAFILFGLVRPGYNVDENLNYLIFVVLLWCIICFVITGLIKLCGGKQKPAANIAVCLHLTALFYLLEMVVAIAAFYFMKNSVAAFKISFIAAGSVLGVIYFPIVLGAMNDLSFKGKTTFASLCAPLIIGLGVLDWQSSAGPPASRLSAPRPPEFMLKPQTVSLPQAPESAASAQIAFQPPPVGVEPPMALMKKPPASAAHGAIPQPLAASAPAH